MCALVTGVQTCALPIWSASQAIQAAGRLERFNLEWIEEPLLYHDVQGHADLKRSTRTPIALGESLYSKYQFLNYLKAGAVDIVQADVAFVGGITEWLKVANLAGSFGKPIAPHYLKSEERRVGKECVRTCR